MNTLSPLRTLPLFLALAVTPITYSGAQSTNHPAPLTRAHAHNDYEHKHPFFDAVEQGFCSVEADIHLVNGQLLVAHNSRDVDPAKTLQSLYLDPMRQRIKKNGGRLYANGPECTLLIDFKTEGKTTYAVLGKVLAEYSDILSVFKDGKLETNAITVVLTGGYSREAVKAQAMRYAVCDGKIPDLEKNPPANLVAWISEDWSKFFKWQGHGQMPVDEKERLIQFVTKAHEQGRRIRFWDAPDRPAFWKEMLADGVDLINTDDLKGFQTFYNSR
ncbi:phosphatidylinositol-specific phospholipase C/glycerophosphodiester phosphodiesterase family protein [Pedosphaera parvula]|uniref:Altered inheritance of mitochondria protein 6 n=1 Tax=Pedosphaera parvula (strain Ellin514) TaxID=320771 RepID=B9XKB9_PEDPL|nr:phosphatidylinositol-specific phospholipase C/glycerophosphodiester phosphodiesterase family protein [Pedosphaera parvula]EEF59757.1 secreted protein [Pedosphaera parvula Ellin514]